MADQHTCPKCGSAHTRVIGRSVSPPASYIECTRCGYATTVVVKAAPPSTVDAQQVEQIARRVVADLNLKLTVVAVAKNEHAWSVMVRTEARRVVRLLIAGHTPATIHAAITDALQGV